MAVSISPHQSVKLKMVYYYFSTIKNNNRLKLLKKLKFLYRGLCLFFFFTIKNGIKICIFIFILR